MNPDFPIREPEDLSPPIVEAPIYQCAQAVYVSGFNPHALVQVYADGVEVVGEAKPHYGFSQINLTRSIEAGEVITATQTVDTVESFHSHDPVTVKPLPALPDGKLPLPLVRSDLYHCGRIVVVEGLVPGVTVFVEEDGNLIGESNTATESTSVFTNQLVETRLVTAKQVLCHDDPKHESIVSEASDPKPVRTIPDSFGPPKINSDSNQVGNDSITLEDLFTGAFVEVSNGTDIVGKGWANNEINRVPLQSQIQSSWSVVARQTLCDKSAESDPENPTSNLRKPSIRGPVCDTDNYISVIDTVVNATVILRSAMTGSIIGSAGASAGVLRLPVSVDLIPGDDLTVVQYMGNNVSNESDPVPVCFCSEDWFKRLSGDILSDAQQSHLPVNCANSNTRLFQNTNPWNHFTITLRADFDKINTEPLVENAVSLAELSYIDPDTNSPESIACELAARGNSRFEHCGWRPLKVLFPGNPGGTLFDGTGRVIKLVTLCGHKAGDQWILGGTDAQHIRRILQEYTLYQILRTFNQAALYTRLVRVNYQDLAGTPLGTSYAFFREREKRAAERCGFTRLEFDEGDGSLPPNTTSDFQTQFHHKFLFSHDYSTQGEHNVIRMSAPDGTEHYLPYDFDLSGVIRPEYSKNQNWTIVQNGEALTDWLASNANQALVRTQIASLLLNEDAMYQTMQNTLLGTPGDDRIRTWLRDHLHRLKCYLNT